jgi:hypothetical protein
MKPLTDKLGAKAGLEDGTLRKRLFDSLISDLIYTPIMTFIMVRMAYTQEVKQGYSGDFGTMFIPSLFLSLVIGYILIFFLMPLFLKLVMKQAGIQPPMGGRTPENDD